MPWVSRLASSFLAKIAKCSLETVPTSVSLKRAWHRRRSQGVKESIAKGLTGKNMTVSIMSKAFR